MTLEDMYNILQDMVGFSPEALDRMFAQTAKDILFSATGWRTFEGYLEGMSEE